MKFKVNDMTCGGCARHIQTALKQQDEASIVVIDLKLKTVEVQSRLNEDKISEIIRNEGYTPEFVTN